MFISMTSDVYNLHASCSKSSMKDEFYERWTLGKVAGDDIDQLGGSNYLQNVVKMEMSSS